MKASEARTLAEKPDYYFNHYLKTILEGIERTAVLRRFCYQTSIPNGEVLHFVVTELKHLGYVVNVEGINVKISW